MIADISPVFRYLPALKWLYLHHNKLTDVKDLCCKEFERLEALDVGTNKIREIPIALAHFMRRLTQLTLVNNDIEKLPHLLGFHKNLK